MIGLVIYVISIVVDECRVHPCENGGVCSLDENFNKHCDCTPTFDGDNCEDGMHWNIFYIENIGYKTYILQYGITITIILSLFRCNM